MRMIQSQHNKFGWNLGPTDVLKTGNCHRTSVLQASAIGIVMRKKSHKEDSREWKDSLVAKTTTYII